MEKYELTDRIKIYRGHTLHQIRAVRDFGNIKAGSLGGYIEKEANLAQDGDCWVKNEAIAYMNASVSEHAQIMGNAVIAYDGKVLGNAIVTDHAKVGCSAIVKGEAKVGHYSWITDHAIVSGRAQIFGMATIREQAVIEEDIFIRGSAWIASTDDYLPLPISEDAIAFRNESGNIQIAVGTYIYTREDFASHANRMHMTDIRKTAYVKAVKMIQEKFAKTVSFANLNPEDLQLSY